MHTTHRVRGLLLVSLLGASALTGCGLQDIYHPPHANGGLEAGFPMASLDTMSPFDPFWGMDAGNAGFPPEFAMPPGPNNGIGEPFPLPPMLPH